MISPATLEVLEYSAPTGGLWRDKRQLNALLRRKLITGVKWLESKQMWSYRFTKYGRVFRNRDIYVRDNNAIRHYIKTLRS